MEKSDPPVCRISRRAFVQGGTLLLAAATSSSMSASAAKPRTPLRIGLVTDLHYADKPPAGTRHYRNTPEKLAEAAAEFAESSPDFVVELGDLIDAADSVETELAYLKRINNDFSAICNKRHYVLGNHCVYSLTKQEFLDGVEQEQSYYSFDHGDHHFVVLDSCFRSDGQPYGRKNFEWTDPNIPDVELDWLKTDLAANSKPTIVFAHQRLDVSTHHGVKNAASVRTVLESADVQLVLQGHSHQNDHKEINGIHYCTLVAMIEGAGVTNNGYSVMTLANDGTIQISGFRKQQGYAWPG
jgi:alkaline phosphatase